LSGPKKNMARMAAINIPGRISQLEWKLGNKKTLDKFPRGNPSGRKETAKKKRVSGEEEKSRNGKSRIAGETSLRAADWEGLKMIGKGGTIG